MWALCSPAYHNNVKLPPKQRKKQRNLNLFKLKRHVYGMYFYEAYLYMWFAFMHAATEDFTEWQAITLRGKIAVFLLFIAEWVVQ